MLMMWRELVKICSGGGGHRTGQAGSSSGGPSSAASQASSSDGNSTTDRNNRANDRRQSQALTSTAGESRRTSTRPVTASGRESRDINYFPAAAPEALRMF